MTEITYNENLSKLRDSLLNFDYKKQENESKNVPVKSLITLLDPILELSKKFLVRLRFNLSRSKSDETVIPSLLVLCCRHLPVDLVDSDELPKELRPFLLIEHLMVENKSLPDMLVEFAEQFEESYIPYIKN